MVMEDFAVLSGAGNQGALASVQGALSNTALKIGTYASGTWTAVKAYVGGLWVDAMAFLSTPLVGGVTYGHVLVGGVLIYTLFTLHSTLFQGKKFSLNPFKSKTNHSGTFINMQGQPLFV